MEQTPKLEQNGKALHSEAITIPNAAAIREHLEKILASRTFRAADGQRNFSSMWLISIRQLPRTRLPKLEIEGTAIKLRVDVGKSSDVQALVTSTVERYGALDYAFNNAEPCPPPYHRVDSATLKRLQKL